MTIEIKSPEVEALIQQRLRNGVFTNVEDVILDALLSSEPQHPTGSDLMNAMQASPIATSPVTEQEPVQRPIWEIIVDRIKALPPEVFERLPNDGASQHDHYIYGLPKRER